MQQEDDLRALAKIMEFGRAVSIFLLVVHVYVYCYPSIASWNLNLEVTDKIIMNFNNTTGIFNCVLWSKLAATLLMAVSCLGTKGVKGEKITRHKIHAALFAGCILFFLNWWILDLPLPHAAVTALYVFTLVSGYLCLLMAGLWMSRLYKHNLMEDVFNLENESFQQETRLMENEYSVNLPTKFQYQGRLNDGWINVKSAKRKNRFSKTKMESQVGESPKRKRPVSRHTHKNKTAFERLSNGIQTLFFYAKKDSKKHCQFSRILYLYTVLERVLPLHFLA